MPYECEDACELELVPDDVIPLSDENTRVVFASLYTYADDKDESAFQKIHLPPICLTVQDLHKMFYQTKLKRFNPFVLNRLVGALSKLALIDAVLANYEASSGNDRMNLTSQQKILLRQELSTLNINNRVKKIVNLDNEDFIASFDDIVMWFDEVEAVVGIEGVDGADEIPFRAQVGFLANVGTSQNVNYVAAQLDTNGNQVPAVGTPASAGYVAPTYNKYGTPIILESGTPASAVYVAEQPYVPHVHAVLEVLSRNASHNVRTSIEINIFSESLQTGIILIVQFIAYVENSPIFGIAPIPLEIIYNNLPGPTTQSAKCGLCVTYDDSA
jgi:hypothetical protein